MEKILTDLSPASLTAAIEENIFALVPLFRHITGAEVHDTPELIWSMSKIAFPLFNSFLRERLPDQDVDQAIREAKVRCQQNDVNMLWWTGPSTVPADLGATLTKEAFISDEVPGMAADLNSFPKEVQLPEGLVLDRVENTQQLEKWVKVLLEVFELPAFVGEAFFGLFVGVGFDPSSPYRNYIGSMGGETVAISSVFLGGGVAGLYNVGTVEAQRHQGIGRAMSVAPLIEARDIGYQAAILQSSAMAVNLYEKEGFKEYCKIYQFEWPPPAAGKKSLRKHFV